MKNAITKAIRWLSQGKEPTVLNQENAPTEIGQNLLPSAAEVAATPQCAMQAPMSFEFHDVCRMFPEMSNSDFEKLVEDIRENGKREPIIVISNKILDGRHRFKACCQLGINPVVKEWDGQGSILAFVLSANLRRRHLSESQRACAAARYILIREQVSKAPESVQGIEPTNRKDALTEAAAAFNVSTRSIEFALKVAKEGAPDLLKLVEQSQLPVSGAAALADEVIERQVCLLANGLPAIRDFLRSKRSESKKGKRSHTSEPLKVGSLAVERKGREYRLKLTQNWQAELQAALADPGKFERLLRSGIKIKLDRSA